MARSSKYVPVLQANVCVERRVRLCVSLRNFTARGGSLCGIAQLEMFSWLCVFCRTVSPSDDLRLGQRLPDLGT